MENRIRIQDDLYEYVNGEWLSTAVIPDDKPMTGGFALLQEDVEKTMMKDFRDFACGEKHSDIPGMEEAVRLYRKILDTERRNREGIEPVRGLLEKIRGISSVEELNEKACELLMEGVDLPVAMDIDPDMKNASSYAFWISGPEMILPDTVYYGQPEGDQLLALYRNMAQSILRHTDLSEEEQKQYIEDTLAYDAEIAKKVKSRLELADYVKMYNPMPLQDVCAYTAPFDLKALLGKLYGKRLPEMIVVSDPKAVKEMNGYFREDTFPQYIHWTYVKTLLKKCACLSEELAALSRTYQRALTGVQKDPEPEKEAYLTAGSVFSEPVGIYYGRTYFGEEAKKDVTEMVRRIIETYKKRMKKNTFLEEKTREMAIRKLSAVTIKMGYPDDMREIFRQLKVNEEDSYFQTMETIGRQKRQERFGRLYIPVDPDEWHMPGHMVNACYDPFRNDITFPAGILQKPFYSLDQTQSENLGGIGTVIAHEISHAFDNNGAQFDENGNLNNWWSDRDQESFRERTQEMIEQWDGIEYCGGTLNGELTVSENIADNGGMAVTLQIMQDTEGSDYREYFINWAKIWCLKTSDEFTQLLLKIDVHSPNKLRANIQVRNFPEWYEAFDVRETDRMFIPEEKRIIIW